MPRTQRADIRGLESLTDEFILEIGPNTDRSRKRLEVFRYLRGLILETFREWRGRQCEASRSAAASFSSDRRPEANEEPRRPARGSGAEEGARAEAPKSGGGGDEETAGDRVPRQSRRASASAPGDACGCPCCARHGGKGGVPKTAFCPVCGRRRRDREVEKGREEKGEERDASEVGTASDEGELTEGEGEKGKAPEWCACAARESGDSASASQNSGDETSVAAACECRCCRVRRAGETDRDCRERERRHSTCEATSGHIAYPECPKLRERETRAEAATPSLYESAWPKPSRRNSPRHSDGDSPRRREAAPLAACSPSVASFVSPSEASCSSSSLSPEGRQASSGYCAEEDEINIAVYRYGSFPLRTFLPDGDLDIGVISYNRRTGVLEGEEESDALLAVLLEKFQRAEVKSNKTFPLREASLVDAEVRILKCIVSGIAVDVSVNKVGGCCSLVFLELADRRIGRNHLFKRSVLLIKSWFAYESHLLGSRSGLLATYCVEALVLHLFHVFPAALLPTPLHLLYHFFSYYSSFHWDRYAVTACGALPLTFITRTSSMQDRRGGSAPLPSRRNCAGTPAAGSDAVSPSAAPPQTPQFPAPSVLDGLLDSKATVPTPPLSPASVASNARPRADEHALAKPGAAAHRRRGEPAAAASAPDGGAATQAPAGGRFMGEHWVGVEYEGREAPWLLARRQRKDENGWATGVDDDPQLERAAVLMLLMQQQRGNVPPHAALTLPGSSHVGDIGLPLAPPAGRAASEVLQAQGPSTNMARMMESVEFVEECRYRFRHSYGAYGAATAQRGSGTRAFPGFAVGASGSGGAGASSIGGGSSASTPSHASSLSSSFSNRRVPPPGSAGAPAGSHASSASSGAGGASGWRKSPFLFRSMNVVDPLHNGNNLARSVSETAFYRLLHAMKKGLQALTHILASGDAARFRLLFLPNSYQLLDRIKSPDVAYPVLRPLIIFPRVSPSHARPSLGMSLPRLPLDSARPDLHHPGQAPFASLPSLHKHAGASSGGRGVDSEQRKRDHVQPLVCSSAPPSTYPPSVASSTSSDCPCRCHAHGPSSAEGGRDGERPGFGRDGPEKPASYSDADSDSRGNLKQATTRRRRSLSRFSPSGGVAPAAAAPALAADAAPEKSSAAGCGEGEAGEVEEGSDKGDKVQNRKEAPPRKGGRHANPSAPRDGEAAERSSSRGNRDQGGQKPRTQEGRSGSGKSSGRRESEEDAKRPSTASPALKPSEPGVDDQRRDRRSSSLGSAGVAQLVSACTEKCGGEAEKGGGVAASKRDDALPLVSALAPEQEEHGVDSETSHASSTASSRKDRTRGDDDAASSSDDDWQSDSGLYDALVEEEKLSDPLTLGDLEAASLLDLCQLLRQPNSLPSHLIQSASSPSAFSVSDAAHAGKRADLDLEAAVASEELAVRGDEVLGDICGLGVDVWRRRLEEIADFLNGATSPGHRRPDDDCDDPTAAPQRRRTREAPSQGDDGAVASEVEDAKTDAEEAAKRVHDASTLTTDAVAEHPDGSSNLCKAAESGERTSPERGSSAGAREGDSSPEGSGDSLENHGRKGRRRRRENTSSELCLHQTCAQSSQESSPVCAGAGNRPHPRLHLLLPLSSPRVYPFGPHSASSPPSLGSARTHSAPGADASHLGSRHSLPQPEFCSLTGVPVGPGGASGDPPGSGSGGGASATPGGLPSRHASAPGTCPASVLGGQGVVVLNQGGPAGGSSSNPFGCSSSRSGAGPAAAGFASGGGVCGFSHFLGSGNVYPHGSRRAAQGGTFIYSGAGLTLSGTALGDSAAAAAGSLGPGSSGHFRQAPFAQRAPHGAHSLASGPAGRPRRRSMSGALQSAVSEEAAAARGSHTGRNSMNAPRWSLAQAAGMMGAPGSVLAGGVPPALRPQGASEKGEPGRREGGATPGKFPCSQSLSNSKQNLASSEKASLGAEKGPSLASAVQVAGLRRRSGGSQEGAGLGESGGDPRQGFFVGMYSSHSDGSSDAGSETVPGPGPLAPFFVSAAEGDSRANAWPAMSRSASGEVGAASRSRASSVLSSERSSGAATGPLGRSWASVAHAAANLPNSDLPVQSAGTQGHPAGGSTGAGDTKFKRSSSLAGAMGGTDPSREKASGMAASVGSDTQPLPDAFAFRGGKILPPAGDASCAGAAGSPLSGEAGGRPRESEDGRCGDGVEADKSSDKRASVHGLVTGLRQAAGADVSLQPASSGAREWKDASWTSRNEGASGAHPKDGTPSAEVSPRSGRTRQARETTWSSFCRSGDSPVRQGDTVTSGGRGGDHEAAPGPPRSQSVPSHGPDAPNADDGDPGAEASAARAPKAVGMLGAGERQSGVAGGPQKAASSKRAARTHSDGGGGAWHLAQGDGTPSQGVSGRLESPVLDFSPDDTVSWPSLPRRSSGPLPSETGSCALSLPLNKGWRSSHGDAEPSETPAGQAGSEREGERQQKPAAWVVPVQLPSPLHTTQISSCAWGFEPAVVPASPSQLGRSVDGQKALASGQEVGSPHEGPRRRPCEGTESVEEARGGRDATDEPEEAYRMRTDYDALARGPAAEGGARRRSRDEEEVGRRENTEEAALRKEAELGSPVSGEATSSASSWTQNSGLLREGVNKLSTGLPSPGIDDSVAPVILPSRFSAGLATPAPVTIGAATALHAAPSFAAVAAGASTAGWSRKQWTPTSAGAVRSSTTVTPVSEVEKSAANPKHPVSGSSGRKSAGDREARGETRRKTPRGREEVDRSGFAGRGEKANAPQGLEVGGTEKSRTTSSAGPAAGVSEKAGLRCASRSLESSWLASDSSFPFPTSPFSEAAPRDLAGSAAHAPARNWASIVVRTPPKAAPATGALAALGKDASPSTGAASAAPVSHISKGETDAAGHSKRMHRDEDTSLGSKPRSEDVSLCDPGSQATLAFSAPKRPAEASVSSPSPQAGAPSEPSHVTEKGGKESPRGRDEEAETGEKPEANPTLFETSEEVNEQPSKPLLLLFSATLRTSLPGSGDSERDEETAHQASRDEETAHQASRDEETAHQASHDEETAHQASRDEETAHQASHDEETAPRASRDEEPSRRPSLSEALESPKDKTKDVHDAPNSALQWGSRGDAEPKGEDRLQRGSCFHSSSSSSPTFRASARREEEEERGSWRGKNHEEQGVQEGPPRVASPTEREARRGGDGESEGAGTTSRHTAGFGEPGGFLQCATPKTDRGLDWGRGDDYEAPHAFSRKAFFSTKARDVEEDVNWRSTPATPASARGAAAGGTGDNRLQGFDPSPTTAPGALSFEETGTPKRGEDSRRSDSRRTPTCASLLSQVNSGRSSGAAGGPRGRGAEGHADENGKKETGQPDAASPAAQQGRLVRGAWTREALLQRPEVLSAMTPEERQLELEQSRQQFAELQESLMWKTATSKRDKKKASATNRRVERQLASLECLIGILSSMDSPAADASGKASEVPAAKPTRPPSH
ncbi:UNVERIFIED_CONTAM: hypothetical protein HHA_214990 [Hammondia hammondi]|eukprot:XP_008886696.1 hypothetical protein HHA_214990 [Hammondia hammondi]